MIEGIFTGETLTGFVHDAESFQSCVDVYFDILDLNGDGVISPDELRGGLNNIVAVETEIQAPEEVEAVYSAIFERFGKDIDRSGFRSLMEEILLAMARSFGSSPILILLHKEGFIAKAIKREADLRRSE